MRQCNVQFNDVIQETGVDPNHLRKLFAAIDIPIPSSNTPPPTLSKGPGHSVPPKEVSKPNSRELPSDKSDIDKQAQMIRRQLEREQRDKERREAEAKAAEMVRKREAAKEEEERQRRSVEVQAAREAIQKKIESLNLKKAASPGIPPTPISSTPVNAAVVKAHPQPIVPTPPVPQVTTRIPGLLLGHDEETPNITGSGDADIVMKDAPVTTVPTRPISTGATPVNPSDSNGVSHPDRSNTVRRKRPMAADLYSESNPIRRKFGAQRSNCLIIEISEDEDEDCDSEQPPQEVREDRKSAEASPLGTPGVSAGGLNHALRRVQTAPLGGLTPNGADALRKKEAEIQRLKEQIMAAQQKKKTIKAASSGMPTPVATPSVGVGPTIPPSQNGASKTVADVTSSPAELLTKVKQSLPAIRPANECEQLANKTAEQACDKQRLKEAEKIKAKQLQILQDEKQIAAKEAEEKRKLEEKAAKQLQEERERKKKQLQEIESAREKKRMAREKLKAERERIRRQEEEMRRQEEEMLREEWDMDELQSSLTKELEVIGSSKQVITSVQSAVQNGAEKQRTEIEAQDKMSEGR
ncbi:hypothetical protein K440DRAFT_263521 [Wilcoxina mikolae CBS 423.85]|nr:hypothetical protein K440DRAFT_263521 [Wilcoxina mikolae CBS 423.85]